MRGIGTLLLAGVSFMGLVDPALAQETAENSSSQSAIGVGEIIVTARRREETLQDVPLTVQAVTGAEISKLNVREFKEIQSLVPGLTLAQDPNGIATRATLRGIAYDVNASGNNGTIEFYLNDAPTSAPILFQSMFDIGQIEVLRGPQGTLRGRASPSGSITVTTRRPDLSEVGGSVSGTVNTWGDVNGQAALNIPLINDRLGIRLAGILDEGDDNRISSINNSTDPSRRTEGGRVSLRAVPFDALTLDGSYTTTLRKAVTFVQAESLDYADPTAPPSPIPIAPGDRLSVMYAPYTYRQAFTVYNWSAHLQVWGQSVNYVGSHNRQEIHSSQTNDLGAALPATVPQSFLDAAQVADITATQTNHELRLSSDTRIAGIFDYVVGALWNKNDNPTLLDIQTPVFAGSAARPLLLNHTSVLRTGGSFERSFFGNLTAHIGASTELSGGIRRIRYHSTGGLSTNGVDIPAADEDRVLHATIYSASLKHNFTRNLMAYASFGTSWRPGSATNPVQLRNQSQPYGLLASLYYPDPEKSKSYELGIKSLWLDGKLRVNLTGYHQTFDNFAYAAPNIFYISDVGGTTGVRSITTLTVGVPAKVDGVELEVGGTPVRGWDIGANLSYANGRITNATIPCNPYAGIPTAADILAATGGQQVAVCQVDKLRSGTNSPFVATLQSSYETGLSSSIDGYLRGLVTFYGKSKNDPTNPIDDISAYGLINLFAGIRAADDSWDIGIYAKNMLDTDRVLSRTATAPVSGASVVGGVAPASAYRNISMTAEREVGITARFAIGSR
ncbi:iron complex outermembrane receptor protein [Novosphingobium sp. PhB165]|uniref:TonB-dependent receptor n=1 Tax=Novosphingobium sp. PhB165 TaxID=2485105 RepID=UPI0010ED9B56|nr:TonB-dependent receptor [Novosphingobium sp. PhB165]TCM20471.1 iron complex outermembrane receptor protein [Novosphingobium sp. PhB165]